MPALQGHGIRSPVAQAAESAEAILDFKAQQGDAFE